MTERIVGTKSMEERLTEFLNGEREMERKQNEGGSHSRNCEGRG